MRPRVAPSPGDIADRVLRGEERALARLLSALEDGDAWASACLRILRRSRADGSGLAHVIGITSHPETDLRRLSDVVLDMGVIEEPCPLGMTPSASMAVMAAIGDALALVLMEKKGITRRDYGLRHHGGYLGHKARLENDD